MLSWASAIDAGHTARQRRGGPTGQSTARPAADEAFEAWASENRSGAAASGATSMPNGSSPPSPRKRARALPKARVPRSRVKPGRSPVKSGRARVKPGRKRISVAQVRKAACKPMSALKAAVSAPRKFKTGRPRLEDRGKTLTATRPWCKRPISTSATY